MKSKQLKREEAAERQEAYNSLSLEAKIAIAYSRKGESKRELVKLLAQQNKGKAA